MRIIFMGTPEFAAPAIDSLLAAGHEIAAVFSQPDKPKGRGYSLAPPPVKVKAMEHNIPVYQPKSMLDAPQYGCINVHASLLPKYRGAAPIQWSVIDGEPKTGVTTMQMDAGLDTGDMLLKSETAILPDETAGELHDRLSAMGAQLIVKTLYALAKGELRPEKQDDSLTCYAKMLTKELCAVDWSRSAQEIHNQIRGLSPWPVATAVLEGKKLKLHRSAVSSLDAPEAGCGEIISLEPLTVKCGSGAVELLEVQAEGKKRMFSADYLRGHKIELGTILQ